MSLKFVVWERFNEVFNSISPYCKEFNILDGYKVRPWQDEKLKRSRVILTLYHTIPTLTTLKKKTFENMAKGEYNGNQHFLHT